MNFKDLVLTEGLINPPEQLTKTIATDAKRILFAAALLKINELEDIKNKTQKFFENEIERFVANAMALAKKGVATKNFNKEIKLACNLPKRNAKEIIQKKINESLNQSILFDPYILVDIAKPGSLKIVTRNKEDLDGEIKVVLTIDDQVHSTYYVKDRQTAIEAFESELENFRYYYLEDQFSRIFSVANDIIFNKKSIVNETTPEIYQEVLKAKNKLEDPIFGGLKKDYNLQRYASDFFDMAAPEVVKSSFEDLRILRVEFFLASTPEIRSKFTSNGEEWSGLYTHIFKNMDVVTIKIAMGGDEGFIANYYETKREAENASVTIQHELIHFKQDLFNFFKKVKPQKRAGIVLGLPPKKIQTGLAGKQTHSMRDVEFYTNLHDSYLSAKELLSGYSRLETRIKIFRNFIGLGNEDIIEQDYDLLQLKANNEAKWKKAITVLFARLKNEGFFDETLPMDLADDYPDSDIGGK